MRDRAAVSWKWVRGVVWLPVVLLPVVLLSVVQGCKGHAVPATVQPLERSVPKVKQPEIPGPLPIEDAAPAGKSGRGGHRRSLAEQPNVPAPAPSDAVAAAAQGRRDARLLQQQEAASQAQQRQLNEQVQQGVRAREQMQAEPRIQSAPEPPASSGLGPDAPRIQDSPAGVPGANGGREAPRIQDAPGPSQTARPTQPEAQPQATTEDRSSSR
ncbi:MAG: hypothetical protein M3Y50_04925 [Acidobacteriota bacterium]|nr:hypothetical protein [Acidobacteriota bacterium]